jgi:hypothetical protein
MAHSPPAGKPLILAHVAKRSDRWPRVERRIITACYRRPRAMRSRSGLITPGLS